MSLPAMSLDLMFCATVERAVRGGGSTLGTNSMVASRFSGRKPLGGARWAISLHCTNRLTKQYSGHVGPPFLAMKLSSWSIRGVTIVQEP